MKNYHFTLIILCVLAIISSCTRSDSEPSEAASESSVYEVEDNVEEAEVATSTTLSQSPGDPTTMTSPAVPTDVAAPPADAIATASGLSYKVLREGTGTEHPTATSEVEVHYSGWTTDGKMFDSSVVRGETIHFPLNGVIRGWTEGVQLMVVGEKTRFWIPGEMAYGDTPQRPGAPAGMLVFDIELFSIKETPPPPPVPEDVAAAPADATVTASGLSYKVLHEGTGTEHPTATSEVEVHYSGWTTDGKMFDSSVVRDETIHFPLNRVIKGWGEGVQLMVVGEKTRFWVPGDMAYGDTPEQPGAPAGMLVFDIELFSIKETPPPPAVPEDVAAPPADATVTASGLSYKVLREGTGTEHPTVTSTVEVHYSGWTTDGKMFDSSVVRGETITFPLNGVIGGWTEGVQLMVVGEKTRFWIPGEMAYGDTPEQPGAPAGMLVFDIELFSIQ